MNEDLEYHLQQAACELTDAAFVVLDPETNHHVVVTPAKTSKLEYATTAELHEAVKEVLQVQVASSMVGAFFGVMFGVLAYQFTRWAIYAWREGRWRARQPQHEPIPFRTPDDGYDIVTPGKKIDYFSDRLRAAEDTRIKT